ncbi:MAG: methytransferase partner Trm112 [Thermoplasmatales archaeon]
MKRELLDIICCPVCKGDLVLSVDSTEDDEIIKGTLECKNCHNKYPIEDGIPNLLPPK